MRAEADRPTTVLVTFDDHDGIAKVVTGVTYQVIDGAGQEIATAVASPEDGDVWAAVVPPQAQLDLLTVVFTAAEGDTVRVPMEVVAERLVTVRRLEESLREVAPELYADKPPDPVLLRRAADAAEDWLDDALNYPAVRRPLRVQFRSAGGPFLRPRGVIHPGDLYQLEIAGSDIDVANAAVFDSFAWERLGGGAWPAGPARIWGTHGLERPSENDRRAATILARYLARTSKIPERAVSMVTESTQIIFSRVDERKPTGLPEVDAVIARRRVDAPV